MNMKTSGENERSQALQTRKQWRTQHRPDQTEFAVNDLAKPGDHQWHGARGHAAALFHPQRKSLVERFHRVLRVAISAEVSVLLKRRTGKPLEAFVLDRGEWSEPTEAFVTRLLTLLESWEFRLHEGTLK